MICLVNVGMSSHKKKNKTSHRVHLPTISRLHVAASLVQELDPTSEAPLEEKIHPKKLSSYGLWKQILLPSAVHLEERLSVS